MTVLARRLWQWIWWGPYSAGTLDRAARYYRPWGNR